ncbi:MAG: heat-inducible transcriptional repressor HrcA [Acidobacteria bacterium]|nr:heat-inducible transcriptional repressor HrcA [Acidobacteriota bacterium]
MSRVGDQLSARDREILREVIATYLSSGEPVSSRRVAKDRQIQLSAATIRNVMADLEDMGYLRQPHVSAGRLPTEAGFHLFIDDLMPAKRVSDDDRRLIDDRLQTAKGTGRELTEETSKLLSQLSHHVGVVLTPALGAAVMRAIEFVPLSGRKVLCVVVAENGFVENKLVVTDELIPREELVRISNYLTENYAGRSLFEIREELLRMMSDERARLDEMLRRAIELARDGMNMGHAPSLVVDGTHSLFDASPNMARIEGMFQMFAERARLAGLLNRCLDADGVRVVLGQDSRLTEELGFGLVVRGYRAGDGVSGSIAVVGPARMEYPRMVPLVNYLGERLSEVLAGGL